MERTGRQQNEIIDGTWGDFARSLVELHADQIDRIALSVPGGVGNIQDIYPLAPAQQGILSTHLPSNPEDIHFVSTVFYVPSRIRIDDLIVAWSRVLERHDILRTSVLTDPLSQPVQVVYRYATPSVEEMRLDRDRDVMEQVQEWIRLGQQHLDLRRAPVIGLRIAADPHSLGSYALLQSHQIVSDLTSHELLISELFIHLQGYVKHLPSPTSYRDYLTHAFAYADTFEAKSFFRRKLGDVSEPTVPFGLLDMQWALSGVEHAAEKLDHGLIQRLRAQAGRLGLSATTLFHAAWGLVVARTSGRNDLTFGSSLSGQTGVWRNPASHFNTLPLRLRIDNATAIEWAEQVHRELAELKEHRASSLEAALRCSGIVGSGPLFTSLFIYKNRVPDLEADWCAAGGSGIRVIARRLSSEYPVTFLVDECRDEFTLTAATDARIDPHRLVQYLRTSLQSLVNALETKPRTPAATLSVLPQHEQCQVVDLFNAPQLVFPQEKLIHQLFEEQAGCTPDAVAIVYAEQRITYAELDSRSNQLAHYLRKRGVKADALVGICIERNLEMVIGLLGILKSGGAYVPLDPHYPSGRLAYMLADAAPDVLLTQGKLIGKLPESKAEVIALDNHWTEIRMEATNGLDLESTGLQSHHLAYVIYTSGSTGKPKGVMVEHRNVTRLFAATEGNFCFDAQDVWTLFHSFAFDFSVWELWGGLLYGGRVVLVPYETTRSPQEFYRLVCSERVTVLNQTPSAFAQFVDAQGRSSQESHFLRLVIFGGEALELRALCPWVQQNGTENIQLVNMYGITETTVHVTYRRLSREELESGQGSPIGKPIADLYTYLLDQYQQLVPIGVIGELYVGGAGVARGYLNRPDLTNMRFLLDPFKQQADARIYRTGDLGRWRPDGTIEYLGRSDHQVKIRGFRIELGEIEAQLVRHPQVREAVVLAREDLSGEKRLVGYVTPRDRSVVQPMMSAEELRIHLKSILPDYMVPSVFVFLESFPLTSNGKLDRRALPAPELQANESASYEAPKGPTEMALADIWRGLLRVDRVSRNDNFFALGGHSLHGMQLILKISKVFAVKLASVAVFEAPSLSEMARLIEGQLPAQASVPALSSAYTKAAQVHRKDLA